MAFFPAWSAEIKPSAVLRTFLDYSQPDRSHMSRFPILIAFHIQLHSLDVFASFGVWILAFIFPKSFGNFQGIVLKINRWINSFFKTKCHTSGSVSLRMDNSWLAPWDNRTGCYLGCLIPQCFPTPCLLALVQFLFLALALHYRTNSRLGKT